MKKRRIMVPIILLALACPVIPGFDSGLKVRCYSVESDAVQAPVRVALIFSTMSFPTIIRNNSCAALGNGIHATM